MMVPFEWQQVRARRNLQPFHAAAVVSESVEVRSKLRRRDDVVMSKSTEDLEGDRRGQKGSPMPRRTCLERDEDVMSSATRARTGRWNLSRGTALFAAEWCAHCRPIY